ncbi:MAG: ABC transporter ATP-binding protein [Firmicutes bacterium]|nr:ABC transporter ATP-binding protein [Bacillota bacterium]
MDKAIQITDLCKKYKNGRGIENVGFCVDRGEIFGFLGPNGAGKTTAMKIITGLIKADSGKAMINGYDVAEEYENAMKSVGTIIEAVAPFGYLTAYENMRLRARYYSNVTDERIDECLNMTGIYKFKNEKTKGFSLGMKQRLGISMAIVSNPSVLILDEPLNGLDVEGMVDMRKLICGMSEKYKTSFLISSHLIHDVELTCTKIGILYNGKMIDVDYTENVLKNYSSLENYYLSEVDING